MFRKGQGLFEFAVIVIVGLLVTAISLTIRDFNNEKTNNDSIKSQRELTLEIKNLILETNELLRDLKELHKEKKPEANFEIKLIPPKDAKEKVLFKDIPEIHLPDPIVHPDGTIIQPTQQVEKSK